MSKKAGLHCPVCDGIYSNLQVHVNTHFDDNDDDDDDDGGKHDIGGPSSVKCDYPGCNAVILQDALEDHKIAHRLQNDEPFETCCSSNLNDSLIARLAQEEENTNVNCTKDDMTLAQHLMYNEQNGASCSTKHIDQDITLAQQLQREEEKKREEEEDFKNLQKMYGMVDNNGGYTKQFEDHMGKRVGKNVSVGDYYNQKANLMAAHLTGYDTEETKTSGMIESIKKHFELSRNILTSLCCETNHFAGSVSDTGWGCGYRNLQMLLSSLLHNDEYKELLRTNLHIDNVPSVPKLQELIETAWENGYDAAGREQLAGKLQRTKKWIGATEVITLLRSSKIKARLVDFHKPTSVDGTHPRLFDWIADYYKDRLKPDTVTPPFPVYIQHQGHSRLCVGYQEIQSGQKNQSLLLFDPSHKVHTMHKLLSCLKENNKPNIKLLKKSLFQMKFRQFQLVFVDGCYESHQEEEESKTIASIRIP